jgi:hypothetical protein
MPSPSRSSFQTQGSWESHSSHGTHPDFESFQSCGSESCDQWLKLREDLKEIETARTSYRGNEQLVMDEMNATLALAQKSIADDSHTDQMTRERLDETCFNAVSEGRSARLSIENSIGPRERDLFKTIDSLQQDIDTGVSTSTPRSSGLRC